MKYQLNPKLAKEADNPGAYLAEAGSYIGRFTRAEKLVSSKSGAHGVGFTFETGNGQSCRFDLWTMNADESQSYYSLRHLNAIMTCLRVKEIDPQPGPIERWNPQTRQRDKVTGYVYPQLMDKPIGVVLQRVEYDKFENGYPSGQTAFKLELYGAYRAEDGFTASEILEKATQPQKLEKLIAAAMKDKLLPAGKKAPAAQAQNDIARANSAAQDAAAAAFDDDDIPF